MKTIRIKWCRTFTIAAVVMMYMVVGAASFAHADQAGGGGHSFEIWFDEYGNGRISVNGGPITPNPGVMLPDPASGMPSLTFFLPELVVNGDVAVFEPGGTSQDPSDGMRFTDANGNMQGFTADRMLFFSDLPSPDEPPPFPLADTGFPPNFGQLPDFNGFVEEVGPEGNNRFDWFPGGNIYHGISDGTIPEPSTLALMGVGIAGFAASAWRRRRARVR